MLPAPVHLSAAGLTLHATRWPAPPGSGQLPLVLVHGLGGSTLEWESVGAELVSSVGAEVIALDLPGFGRSRLPRGRAGVALGAAALAGVLEQVGRALVVGNSMGGLISLRVASQHPDLVAGLVLVDPALSAGTNSSGTLRTAARYAIPLTPLLGPLVISARRRRQEPERYVDERLAAIVARPARVNGEVRSRMIEQAAERAASRQRRAETARCYSDAARSIFTGVRRAWQAVGAVASPTLVIHGADDALVPVALVDRLRSVRPDWTYEVRDDCGHLPHLEEPAWFVETIAGWLAGPAFSSKSPPSEGEILLEKPAGPQGEA